MLCDGCGYCLTIHNIICEYKCKPRKCSNFIICNNREPYFILEFNRGVCNECSINFGKCIENPTSSEPKLVFSEKSAECPVCLQVSELNVKNPRCSHFLCVSCIKAIYWYDMNEFPDKPKFPHAEKESEYYENPDWYLNDEFVVKWKKELGSWNEERINYVLDNKKYLKRCPLCRL